MTDMPDTTLTGGRSHNVPSPAQYDDASGLLLRG